MEKRRELCEKVKSRAEGYFSQGYNCAQAVALSNIEAFGGRTEGLIALSAGFGRGMHAGCSCGAFTGGIMALGQILAGPDTRGFDRRITAAAATLHQNFVAQFGMTCCRGLRQKLSPWKNARCRTITATTAGLTCDLLLDYQARPQEQPGRVLPSGALPEPGG